jgi:broad specificity phosphatase PhoE
MINKSITLIRHAESYNNIIYSTDSAKYFSFRQADPELSPNGKAQALELEEYILKNQSILNLDLIISSPMIRAIQTSEIVFRKIKANKIILNNISEIGGLFNNQGMQLGLKRSEFIRSYPDYKLNEDLQDQGWSLSDRKESIAEGFQRVSGFIKFLIQSNEFQRIAVVTHRKFMSYFFILLLKEYINVGIEAKFKFKFDNTGLTTIIYSNGCFIIKEFNILPHLN